MSTEENRSTQITAQLIADLQSENESTILKAIEKAKDKGSIQLIPILISIYPETENKIQIEIRSILEQLKVSEALDILMEELIKANNTQAELILNSIWNSNLDASDYIPQIVEAACRYEYMTAFEALTVIENMEGPFAEEKLSDARITINEYFEKSIKPNEEILKTILNVILEMDNAIEG